MASLIDEQSLLLGLSRSATPANAEALAQVALMGQRQRFQRPSASPAADPLEIAGDPRPIISETARRLFRRLFAEAPKSPSDRLEEAAVAALAAARYRLHPFDFAELEPLVLRHGSALGPTATSWAAIVRPRASDEDEDDESAAALLRARRASDPAGARVALEPMFGTYSAKERLAILDALQVRLGPGDVAFLAGLQVADKAGSVRDRALELLGRIPATDAYAARLARARDHLKVETSGIVFRKKSLSVIGITEKSGSLWQLLAGLRIDDLASALGFSGKAFIELAADTADLAEVILHGVLSERRFEFVRLFDGQMRDDGSDWILMLSRLLPAATPEDRTRLLEVCVDPQKWARLPMGALATLHASWGGPLPVNMAGKLLGSPAWKALLETAELERDPRSQGIPEAMAALIPVALSKRFITDVEPLSRRAADYHRFLLALAEEAP